MCAHMHRHVHKHTPYRLVSLTLLPLSLCFSLSLSVIHFLIQTKALTFVPNFKVLANPQEPLGDPTPGPK